MALKFGIFDHLERRYDVPMSQQFQERLDLLAQADEAGVYGYHIAEHHHSPLCLAPNQAVFLSAVAARTERLRFGPLVYVLPLHNPIRLIEEISMVDQLSGGRFQIGVGRGTGGGTEFAMWGGDAGENGERYNEILRILVEGMQSDFLTHSGKHFQYEDLWMELRPKQTPHPPFWYAGNAEAAPSGGMNFIGTGRTVRFADTVKLYQETWKQCQESGTESVLRLDEPLYGVMKHMYIADTDEEALDRARESHVAYRSHYAKPVRPRVGEDGPSTSEEWNEAAKNSVFIADQEPDADKRRAPSSLSFDRAYSGEALIAGSPTTVRQYLEQYHEQSGANYFVSSFQWGDLTHEEASHSLELFMSEVAPAAS